MHQYLNCLHDLLQNGVERPDRTGTGTLALFGRQLRFDLRDGFPLLTTKKLHLRSIIHELLWFLKGETNIAYLKQNQVRIWDEWADENGDLGPIYGQQWRAWNNNIDQLAELLQNLKTKPYSRRHIVSAWNVGDLAKMALPPCHVLFQFYVDARGLSLQLYQRSADFFLGVPFNIASYALLLSMVAAQVNLTPYELIWVGGDVHLYSNHIDQAKEQLERQPFNSPQLILAPRPSLFDYRYEDFKIVNYQSHPAIKAPIAV